VSVLPRGVVLSHPNEFETAGFRRVIDVNLNRLPLALNDFTASAKRGKRATNAVSIPLDSTSG
jgi:hypothetical protein